MHYPRGAGKTTKWIGASRCLGSMGNLSKTSLNFDVEGTTLSRLHTREEDHVVNYGCDQCDSFRKK